MLCLESLDLVCDVLPGLLDRLVYLVCSGCSSTFPAVLRAVLVLSNDHEVTLRSRVAFPYEETLQLEHDGVQLGVVVFVLIFDDTRVCFRDNRDQKVEHH